MNFINHVTNDSIHGSLQNIRNYPFLQGSIPPPSPSSPQIEESKNKFKENQGVSNENILRVDFLFSYWIFAWFLLYYSSKHLSIVPVPSIFSWINPIISLYIALIENILHIFLIYTHLSFDIFFKYIAMMLCVKVLPIYLLYNSKINWYRDIFGTITLFIIYLAWLNYNNTTLWDVYSKVNNYIVNGNNKTPFFATLQWISQ